MQLYIIDNLDRLVSGPHPLPAKGQPAPIGGVITEYTPPEPGEGEVVFHKGVGIWGTKSDVEVVTVPLETSTAHLTNLDHGQFRLLFTFAERQAEETYRQRAIKLVQGDAPTLSDPPTQAEYEAAVAYARAQTYLAMRADFDAASHINLTDEAVRVALEFYVALGLLGEPRMDEVLNRVTPA